MSRYRRVKRAFDRSALARICQMHEAEFGEAYGLDTFMVSGARSLWHDEGEADRYYYRDNGSDILFVAHLDTVVKHRERKAAFADTAGGPIVYSGALDDRLGAYIGLELLPTLGVCHDVLLTTGEESGLSTADHFETDKGYNWVIEFDRGGTDVVMYEYETPEIVDLVQGSGAKVGVGIFSDICYLEQLGVKAFNWGVGYRDYHSVRGHAWLDDTYNMVANYLRFHDANSGLILPHTQLARSSWWGNNNRSWDVDGVRCGICDEEMDGPWSEGWYCCPECVNWQRIELSTGADEYAALDNPDERAYWRNFDQQQKDPSVKTLALPAQPREARDWAGFTPGKDGREEETAGGAA